MDQAGIDENGNVFSVDGTHIGTISGQEDKNDSTTDPVEDKTADEFEGVDPERFDMGDFGSTTLGGNVFSLHANIDCAECDESNTESDTGTDPNETVTVNVESTSKEMSSPLSCLATVLMCFATAITGLATSLNGNRRVLATSAACLATGVGAVDTSNAYAMSTAFAAPSSTSVTWDAHLDSGTSVTASGRCNLSLTS